MGQTTSSLQPPEGLEAVTLADVRRAVEAEGKACVHRREAVRWIALLRELCVHAHEWR